MFVITQLLIVSLQKHLNGVSFPRYFMVGIWFGADTIQSFLPSFKLCGKLSINIKPAFIANKAADQRKAHHIINTCINHGVSTL
jgi:hypothetical protein